MGPSGLAACRGECSPKTRVAYIHVWGKPFQNKLTEKKRPKCESNGGPGTNLARFFTWLGQVDTGSCGCRRFARKMDRWGVKGCRKHMGEILAKLQTEAWKRSIPVTKSMLRPIVKRAIRLAERKPDSLSDV